MTTATAGLLLLTLVLRLLVIVADGNRLQSDPDSYVRLATTLADGHGYSTPGGQRPTAFRPVLYPLLLAAPVALGISAPAAAAAFNVLAGLLFVWAVIRLARECGLPRNACLLAGFLAAADPLLLRYTTEPMTENLCAVLITVALLWVLRFAQMTVPVHQSRAMTTGVVAGILLGLSALCRPVALVSCVFLTLAMLIMARRTDDDVSESRTSSALPKLLWMLLPAVVTALTVSPWIIRNAIQFQTLIPATTHGGYTLLLGNNSVFYDKVVSGQQSVWDGESLGQWQSSLDHRMQTENVDRADERAVDQWMYQRAVSEIRERPQDALKAIVLRWRRFWALTSTLEDSTRPPIVNVAVGLWYGLLGAGLIVSLWPLRHDRRIVLLWVSVASFLTVHSFYWTNTRMRAPLTGVIIVLGVAGWTWLVSRPRLSAGDSTSA